MKIILYLTIILLFFSCQNNERDKNESFLQNHMKHTIIQEIKTGLIEAEKKINKKPKRKFRESLHSIRRSFSVPKGYKSIRYKKKSYAYYIKRLPLKLNKEVKNYRKNQVFISENRVLGVVKMPLLFKKDLEQCADFAMRFWAEYHRIYNAIDRLFLYTYSGKKRFFKGKGQNFYQYLYHHMIYTNSYSIKKGARKILEKDLMPGDMIVQNKTGGIGHVSVILNKAVKKNKADLYLIGFSFMPAQEFHIERAGNEYGVSGWFYLKGFYKFLKKHFNYGKPVLRRF